LNIVYAHVLAVALDFAELRARTLLGGVTFVVLTATDLDFAALLGVPFSLPL